jgi:predicted amidohydrolase YtcJ
VGKYVDHVKIGGYKILLDGSPQGRTAWMRKPYENSGDYCGYPWLTDEQVHECVKKSIADNQQLLTHCNGDAASEQLLNVYEAELAASDNPNKANLRPVMIHCQTVGDDQLDRMAAIKMVPSIFVGHTWYWGDVHLKNFGDARGRRVSPVKSALDRGLVYNFHTDTPITRPIMLHSAWAAANRITRSGAEIGPEQRVSAYEALKGITINSAYAYFEEDTKGSIKAGKRADLVILSENPLKGDAMKIRDIKVLETIKDGETIYKAE